MVFGIVEWIVLTIIFAFFEISISLDRKGKLQGIKWLAGIGALIYVLIYAATHGVAVYTWAFAVIAFLTACKYLGIGLLYSVVEFLYTAHKARELLSEEWALHKANWSEKYDSAKDYNAEEVCRRFDTPWGWADVPYRIFNLSLKGTTPQVIINRPRLIEWCSAWAFLWPAYLFDLIVGRLLEDVWLYVSDVSEMLAKKYTKFLFRNTFK